MNDKKVVAIYCRLSDEDKNKQNINDDSESIQNQKSMLIDYAIQKNWSIYNIYSDDDYSGTDNTRPEWNKMLQDAQQSKCNIILCKTQSRFSRDMEIIERYIHNKFLEWNIRFVSIVDNADTEVKGNKKARQINGLINEWYLEDLSDNIRSVFNNKMKKGEYIAPFAPYGYAKDPSKKNHLIIDDYASEVVKKIFNLHFEGYGASKIAKILNDSQIQNPRKYQEINGLRKTLLYKENEVGLWSTTSIGDILHNQTYCGDTVQGTLKKASYKSNKVLKQPKDEWIIVKDTHEPIISRDLFDKVQGNLATRRRSGGTGDTHVLAGKVLCFYCGRAMQKIHTQTTIQSIDYLRCRQKYYYSDSNKCSTPNIRLDFILNILRERILEQFNNIDTYSKDIKLTDITKSNDKKFKTYQQNINSLNTSLNKYQNALKNLYLDKVNEVITEEQFKEFNLDFSNKIVEIQNNIKDYQNKIQAINNNVKTNIKIEDSIKEFLKTKTFTRNIINNLVDKIVYGEVNPSTEKPILEIKFNWE